MQKPLLFLLFLLFNASLMAQVVINEYSASNLRSFQDNFLKTEDWVELYNTSDQSVDIGGWYLSDKVDNPQKWEIPAGISVQGNDHLIIWLSGRDALVGGNIHASFKLTQTKENESLVLSNAIGNIVNSFPLQLTLQEHSQCREIDGGSTWMTCTAPTPGDINDFSPQFTRYTEQATMSLNGGFYAGEQTISIQSTESNATVRYTTDGTIPLETSPEYTMPITVTSTQVLKARVFSNDTLVLPGKVAFNTYFIDEDFTLAVISVAADSVIDLANGAGEIRPIGSIEYFDVNKVRTATSYGELNRHGQDSWILDHRSIDWISRDEMGYNSTIKTELFSYSDRDEYQRIMMRASGDDNYPANDDANHVGSTHVRDEYVHTLAQKGGMELDVRAVERIVVYLNGEYWGVYGLRERPVDHDYTSYFYDQGKYDLHYLNTWGSTWAEYGGQEAFDDWADIRDFILNNDMSDSSNYEVVKDKINLTSMIDYMIANLNSVASDWMNYNTGFWRGTNPDGKRKKWTYILWDNDATFDYYINYSGVPNTDPDAVPCDIEEISEFMDEFFDYSWTGEDVGMHDKLFLKLQEENETFRQLYYSRQADLMNTVYTCENMLSTLDEMIAVIEPEMPRHIARWGGTVSEWQDNVANLRSFIEQRCTLLDDGMVECYDVTGPYEITLMVEPAGIGVGEIDFNTLDIEEFPWTGNYFGGMENLIKAKSFLDDYEFAYWESKSGNVIFPDPFSRRASITMTQADTLIAHFALPNSTFEPATNFSFSVYPTLVDEYINVVFDLDEAMEVQLSLFSVAGKEILNFDAINGRYSSGEHQEQIDLKSLGVPPGMYFLNFKGGSGQVTRKITVIQ